jgi:hypothetical protein
LGKKTLKQPVYVDLPEGIKLNKQMWERVYKLNYTNTDKGKLSNLSFWQNMG